MSGIRYLKSIRLRLSVSVRCCAGQGEWNLSWTVSDGKNNQRTYHSYTTTGWRVRGVINTAATRGGNGNHCRGGGGTGPQGHILRQKNKNKNPNEKTVWFEVPSPPRGEPRRTTLLNLEFGKPDLFSWGAIVAFSTLCCFPLRGFFLPGVSASPLLASGAGLWVQCGWWETW